MSFFDSIFGHSHRLSRVFTIKRRTYQVCLICGTEVLASPEQKRNWNAKRKATITAVADKYIEQLERSFKP